MNRKLKLAALGLATAAFPAMFLAGRFCSGGTAEHRTITMSHSFGQKHPIHKFLADFAAQVDHNSNGKISIKIYDSAQLGAEPQFLEQLRLGILDGGVVSNQIMTKYAPVFLIFQYPYIWQDELQVRAFLNNFVETRLAALLQKSNCGFSLCCSLTNGMNGLYFAEAAVPVQLENQRKKQFFAYAGAPSCVKYFTKLGLIPIPIAKGEVYSALQMRMINVGENTLPGLISSKHFETAKIFVATNHTPAVFYLVFNSNFMAGLSAGEKALLQQAWSSAKVKYEKISSPDLAKMAEKSGIAYQRLSEKDVLYLRQLADSEFKKGSNVLRQVFQHKESDKRINKQ